MNKHDIEREILDPIRAIKGGEVQRFRGLNGLMWGSLNMSTADQGIDRIDVGVIEYEYSGSGD